MPVRGGTSTEEKRSCRTTSRDGTSSTEGGRRRDVTLAEHAGKVDRDLGPLLPRFAGLGPRTRREPPPPPDPAPSPDAYARPHPQPTIPTHDASPDPRRHGQP